jgi:F0F1-type ATP synthase assembly protein I
MDPRISGRLADERRDEIARTAEAAPVRRRAVRLARPPALAALILGLAVGLLAGVDRLASTSPLGTAAAVVGLLAALVAVERVGRRRRPGGV